MNRRAAANRANGRKSRGPRTPAGKERSSRNALRHGLAAVSHCEPAHTSQIEQIAQAICGGDSDPLLLEQARIIAACDIQLRCLRAEQVGVIDRLWDGTAIALAKGDNSIELAQARSQEAERAFDEMERMKAQYGITGDDEAARRLEKAGFCRLANDWIYSPALAKIPRQPGWEPTPMKERDEVDSVGEALPDLLRLARYERRAWSRRKRALRRFMALRLCDDRSFLSPAEPDRLRGS